MQEQSFFHDGRQDFIRFDQNKKKFKTFYHFFKTLPLFSRLFPGLKNCWANFKTFSRIQDCVRTLYLRFTKRISTDSKTLRQSTKHLRLQSEEEKPCLFMREFLSGNRCYLHAAQLAQSVVRLTAERGIAGSIPRTSPTLRVLK